MAARQAKTASRPAQAARKPRAKPPAKPKAEPRKAAAKKPPAAARPPRAAQTPTVTAVRAEVRELDRRVPGIAKGAVAATAVAMAKRLDDPETTAPAAGTCGRVLLAALEQLRALAPPEPEDDDAVDQLAQRHADRRAAA